MTSTDNVLKVVSWNVRGLGNTTKTAKVMAHLQQLKGDIFFLQETHLRNKEIRRLKRSWISHVFHSRFNARARGTAILIRNNIMFEQHKIIADTDGRFIIVVGKLQNSLVILACVYGPNWDDSTFMPKLFSSIPDIEKHYLILGGDFNMVQDTCLDRSSKKPVPLSNTAKSLNMFKTQLGLVDPWRHKNPTLKQFSFFSHPHRTYTRIDFFLIDIRLLSKMKDSDYHTIAISDHAPASLDLELVGQTRSFKPWRFNSTLLTEEDYKQFLKNQISLYFDLNDSPNISRSTLWEASKAYMRGQLISFTANLTRKKLSYTNDLLIQIKEVDFRYATNPDPDLYNERVKLQTDLNLTTSNTALLQLTKTRQRFFESGDKAGKLLAFQARAQATSKLIPFIRSDTGEILSDPSKINNRFASFYSELYTSTNPPSPHNILNDISFPRIDNELRGLGGPITIIEVQESIKSLKSGKSPGPDGFSSEYYKANVEVLAPVLAEVYNEAFSNRRLPSTLSEATISLILKNDKDASLCSSYRPISLLNVDFKILSKILATRLQQVLPHIISLDQTGFMIGRQSFHNTRRLLNIIHTPGTPSPEIIVSLDAEKAFDRVEWSFLYEVMEHFGFDNDFILWVKLLYSSPVASIKTNDMVSSPFPLGRGTRQGCPLSPLLFAIVIEPLAIWLRAEEGFKGILRAGVTHKVSLYADDLLLYISDPHTSLPAIFNILEQYSKLSGYRPNYQKSQLFPLNSLARSLPKSISPFKWAETGFRYLGIFICPSLSNMMNKNFLPLLESMEKDFDRWTLLPLSLVGRANLVKMVIFPKFLYLFQHVPILITKTFFDRLDRKISQFLWLKKPARLRKSVLQSPKCEGGLALPNFKQYYWAANIQKLLYWRHDADALPAWVQIERACSRYTLSSLFCSQLPLPLSLVEDNPIVRATLTIWSQFRKKFGLHGPSTQIPLAKNCNFMPSVTDLVFKLWHDKGIKTVNDLYSNNTFSSFADLSSKFQLPNSHLFRFFQARDYVKKVFPHFPNRPPETLLDTLLQLDPQREKVISFLYNSINNNTSNFAALVKTAWEGELGAEVEEEQWEAAKNLIHKSSVCARHALIQCKILYKVHYTNAKLARIYPSVSDVCNRCGQSPANHTHMFWACPKLSGFWGDIFKLLSQAYNQAIHPNPLSAIFGIPLDPDLSRSLKQVLAFSTLLARRLILLRWKHSVPPSHDQWVREVLYNLKLEKLRFSLKGSTSKFMETWRPFLSWAETMTLLPDTEES